MWCEMVMVPNLYGHSTPSVASTAAASAAAAAGAGPQSSSGSTASFASSFPSVPSVTGIPLNKVVVPTAGGSTQKMDTSKHFHVFVGDLAPEVETQQLKAEFNQFGFVTDCKIIKDMHTQKPKGYGFVAFATKDEAEEAMKQMNGKMIGSRTIRTNWAVRRPPQPPDQKPLNYEEVNMASSELNTTVYVGGITLGLCEELLRAAFGDFGDILECRIFKEKGYAFIRFDSHEAATRAIVNMHGKPVGDQPCKCSWGKESTDGKDGCQTLLTPYPYYAGLTAYPYGQTNSPLSYLQTPSLAYPASATNVGFASAAAAAAAAAAANSYQNRTAALLGSLSSSSGLPSFNGAAIEGQQGTSAFQHS